jgi:ribonuclease BN (tRNA processing enzyme)
VKVRFLGSGDAFGGRFRPASTSNRVRTGSARLRRVVADRDAALRRRSAGDRYGDPFPPATTTAASVSDPRWSVQARNARSGGRPAGVEKECAKPWVFFQLDPNRAEVRDAFRRAGRSAVEVGPVHVTGYEVSHASGAPPFALRITGEGKIVTYSGDTEWTESLVDAARGADLFIAEALSYDKRIRYHLDLATLLQHRSRLDCRRLILTHMGEDVLARLDGLAVEAAEDGKQLLV